MIRTLKSYVIIILFAMLAPSFAASETSPCYNQTNSTACKLVWSSNNAEGFKSSNVHSDDEHAGQVSCTPRPEAGLFTLNEYSNDNKTLTINYFGLKHTCYTRIDNLINQENGNIKHGYIEATIKVNPTITIKRDSGTGNYYPVYGEDQEIWPAFFLYGANWPTQGEVDIAEAFFYRTGTYLHGEDYYTNESSVKGSFIGPPSGLLRGLYDHEHAHAYGLEWELIGDDQILLNIYYDHVFQYSSGVHNTSETPYSQIKKGFQNGTISVAFDTDQGPNPWTHDLRYSMTVSDVNVYSVS